MTYQLKVRQRGTGRLNRLVGYIGSQRQQAKTKERMIQPIRDELDKSEFQFKLKKQNLIYKKSLVGDIRFHNNMKSKYLDFSRDIIVYLPPGYKKVEHARYPVLYMHDGNNLFDPETSFAGVSWAVNDTVEKLIQEDELNEIIVVGIYNTPARLYEYTWRPMELEKNEEHGGLGKKYARFLVNELKPFIDRKYRTLANQKNTAVMGSSLGGLINFYLACHYGDIFGKVGMISPSFWWGMGEPLKDVTKLPANLKLWMDMGYFESGSTKIEDIKSSLYMTRLMKKFLLSHGYEEDKNLVYFEDTEGFHDERSWARRVHRPLLFFFGKNSLEV